MKIGTKYYHLTSMHEHVSVLILILLSIYKRKVLSSGRATLEPLEDGTLHLSLDVRFAFESESDYKEFLDLIKTEKLGTEKEP